MDEEDEAFGRRFRLFFLFLVQLKF